MTKTIILYYDAQLANTLVTVSCPCGHSWQQPIAAEIQNSPDDSCQLFECPHCQQLFTLYGKGQSN